MKNHDIKSLTRPELTELVLSLGGKPYWADYLFSFMHAKNVAELSAVTPIPKAFRETLRLAGHEIHNIKRIGTFEDPDGTVKYLLEDPEQRRWEAVCLRDGERRTLCISCQVGCRMGCRFCATGQLAYTGNLTAGQIVDQVYQVVATGIPIHNVVFMGMGEPFDNLDAVLGSIRLLNDPKGQHIGQRRITVSTCGLPDGIDRFSREDLQVRLAISLHAPNDALRKRLMPINQRYPLSTVLAAVQRYQRATGRRVTFEYCMIGGYNDQVIHARELIARLQGLKAHVNLIGFNPFPGCTYAASDQDAIERFAAVLRRAGMETVIRLKRGPTIQAACGQLGALWLDSKNRND